MGSEQTVLAIFVVALLTAAGLTAASLDVSAQVSLQAISPGVLWDAARDVALDDIGVPLGGLLADAREALAGLAREARHLRDILAP